MRSRECGRLHRAATILDVVVQTGRTSPQMCLVSSARSGRSATSAVTRHRTPYIGVSAVDKVASHRLAHRAPVPGGRDALFRRCRRPSSRRSRGDVLAQRRLRIAAAALARHLAVRVPGHAAAGRARAQQPAGVVGHAIADPAEHIAILVAEHAAASPGTVDLSGRIHQAVAGSAVHGSVVVAHAVAGEHGRDRHERHESQRTHGDDATRDSVGGAADP